MLDGSIILASQIWQNGEIVADVWFEDSDVFTLAALERDVSNYYLKQMNFMGNIITT